MPEVSDEPGVFDQPEATFTDEELTELALAADPREALDDDAVPLADPDAPKGPLPAWYMPVARARTATPTRRIVAAVVISAFLLINVLGLCITYGWLEVA